MTFFYFKEESAWRFCRRKLKKACPHAQYKGCPWERLAEYCVWLSAATWGESLLHCYPVFPVVKEGKEGWRQMVDRMIRWREET